MRPHLFAALIAAGATLAAQTGRSATDTLTADLVLVNGRVYTVDATKPWVEALAVRHGVIVATGTTAEIQSRVGPATTRIDLAGAFATAGFNDAHVHVESTGALLTGANLLDVQLECIQRGTACAPD